MALHAGPLIELTDLFQNRPAYSGLHVTRAARIEAVTLRGCVYASEPFAAALSLFGAGRFLCDRVGALELAKNYDRCTLFHVTRA